MLIHLHNFISSIFTTKSLETAMPEMHFEFYRKKSLPIPILNGLLFLKAFQYKKETTFTLESPLLMFFIPLCSLQKQKGVFLFFPIMTVPADTLRGNTA